MKLKAIKCAHNFNFTKKIYSEDESCRQAEKTRREICAKKWIIIADIFPIESHFRFLIEKLFQFSLFISYMRSKACTINI